VKQRCGQGYKWGVRRGYRVDACNDVCVSKKRPIDAFNAVSNRREGGTDGRSCGFLVMPSKQDGRWEA
jgi:hypothetical protein